MQLIWTDGDIVSWVAFRVCVSTDQSSCTVVVVFWTENRYSPGCTCARVSTGSEQRAVNANEMRFMVPPGESIPTRSGGRSVLRSVSAESNVSRLALREEGFECGDPAAPWYRTVHIRGGVLGFRVRESGKQPFEIQLTMTSRMADDPGLAIEARGLTKRYGDRAAVYLVHSDSEITLEVALEHAVLSEVKATVLVDKTQALAKQVKATITPEAVVLSPKAETLYKGRINDLYLGPTKRQRAATTQDLRDAIDAVLADKPVPTPQHEAQGCKIGGMK